MVEHIHCTLYMFFNEYLCVHMKPHIPNSFSIADNTLKLILPTRKGYKWPQIFNCFSYMYNGVPYAELEVNIPPTYFFALTVPHLVTKPQVYVARCVGSWILFEAAAIINMKFTRKSQNQVYLVWQWDHG